MVASSLGNLCKVLVDDIESSFKDHRFVLHRHDLIKGLPNGRIILDVNNLIVLFIDSGLDLLAGHPPGQNEQFLPLLSDERSIQIINIRISIALAAIVEM